MDGATGEGFEEHEGDGAAAGPGDFGGGGGGGAVGGYEEGLLGGEAGGDGSFESAWGRIVGSGGYDGRDGRGGA